MSVSLREVEELLKSAGVKNIYERKVTARRIADLFPAQITEEELEKILPAKKTLISPWDSGFNVARESCRQALIGKCAAPTFSGEENK
jgi:hypothetical protein